MTIKKILTFLREGGGDAPLFGGEFSVSLLSVTVDVKFFALLLTLLLSIIILSVISTAASVDNSSVAAVVSSSNCFDGGGDDDVSGWIVINVGVGVGVTIVPSNNVGCPETGVIFTFGLFTSGLKDFLSLSLPILFCKKKKFN